MPLGTRTHQGYGPQNAYGYRAAPLTRDQSRGVFGQVMGLVALTFGCLALGAYITRDAGHGGVGFFLLAIGCILGLNAATARGREQLAIGLLFGMGLALGLAIGPTLASYASADPGAVYEAAGSTAGFTAILGCYGYATRRDLSRYMRAFLFGWIALLAFGLIALWVAIPGANVIWSVLGLVLIGGFTAFDFQRLRNANMAMAVPIAASIFLDIFNAFLFMLTLFGGGGRGRQ